MQIPPPEDRSVATFPVVLILSAMVGIAGYLAIAGSLRSAPSSGGVYLPVDADTAEAGQ